MSDYVKSGYCELILAAHTDNSAGNSYNMELSKRRADAVSDYLKVLGVDERKIDKAWYGETKPDVSNTSDEGRSENRRVDIILKEYHFESAADVLKCASPEYKQTFTLKRNAETKIKGKDGTVIYIPQNALVTKDGKTVTSNKVEIQLEEYLKPADAVYNQLSTISDGRILESGGMFTVTATADGEELQLKEGSALKVQLPVINKESDMQVFTALKNEEGVTEWKPMGVPFALEGQKKIAAPFVKLNTGYLKSIIPVPDYSSKESVSNRYILPAAPTRPIKPSAPKDYEIPDIKTLRTPFERLFMSAKKEAEIVRHEVEKKDAAYDKRVEKFQKREDDYTVAINKYIGDSINYEVKTRAAFKEWATAQKKYNEEMAQAYDQQRLSNALNTIIALSDSNQFTNSDPERLFFRLMTANEYLNDKLYMHERAVVHLNRMISDGVSQSYFEYAKNGVVDIKALSRTRSDYACRDYSNTFLSGNNELREMFKKAQMELIARREELGLLNEGDVNNVYNASLSGFGSYNCDRFNDVPQNRMVELRIQYKGDAKVSFYIPSINGYIYAYKTGDEYVTKLPMNMEATLVILGFDYTDGPLMLTEKKSYQRNAVLKPQPKPVTLKEVRQTLASL